MAITQELVKDVSEKLYSWALRKVPDDTKDALRRAMDNETSDTARKTLAFMLRSAQVSEESDRFVCSDSGVPVYFVQIGTKAKWDGDFKQAIKDGFDHLVETIQPPILKHVTNPLTLERGYKGKDMPMVSFDFVSDADYVDITCSPKALGSGRWAALELFSFPTLEQIEAYVMDVVIKAGSQHCPPVVIGVGIGGSFDYAAKLAKECDAAAARHDQPRADPCGDGGAPHQGGQRDRLRPDGHRRRDHGARRPYQLCVGARLHAGRGLLQLLDQPPHPRAHLQRRHGRADRVASWTRSRPNLQLPLTDEAVRSLDARRHGASHGRDRHHRRHADARAHHRLSRPRRGAADRPHRAAFFHLGSYNQEDDDGFEILYMNPTTSTRFNALMPRLIRTFGLRAVGGKGGLDRACADAMKEVGCVYLSFLGGGAPILSDAIKSVVTVEWNDLIAHYRLVKLEVDKLGPLTVAIDAHGNTLYENLQVEARQKLPEILAELDRARAASAKN